LSSTLETNRTDKLETLFWKGLRESMDRLIIDLKEQQGSTMLLTDELATALGYTAGNIRKLVERGKSISVVRNNKHYSHPSLVY